MKKIFVSKLFKSLYLYLEMTNMKKIFVAKLFKSLYLYYSIYLQLCQVLFSKIFDFFRLFSIFNLMPFSSIFRPIMTQ